MNEKETKKKQKKKNKRGKEKKERKGRRSTLGQRMISHYAVLVLHIKSPPREIE